jgi:DNA (cytosine-5)-methyltransferase 1
MEQRPSDEGKEPEKALRGQRVLRIGSLCTGYGGLDMAVTAVFNGRLIWSADNDRHVSVLLDKRYPDVPNLGDLTRLDWATVESVDIMAAGFPCQDISYNGRGAGIEKGARSGIWKNIVTGLRLLRPKLVVVENVAAIRRRGLDRVLGDLAELGYYAVWTSLRASEVGAPHRRERVFILGYRQEAASILTAAHARSERRPRRSGPGDTASGWPPGGPERSPTGAVPVAAKERPAPVNGDGWGRYREAVERWAAVIGRPAPEPTGYGIWGQTRLSPQLSEWLMGLPAGFVTDLDLPYSAQLRILGNGVVPQQADVALRLLVRTAVAGGAVRNSEP